MQPVRWREDLFFGNWGGAMTAILELYTEYLQEIENRKSEGLSPKPIEDGGLLGEIISQIKGSTSEHREACIEFFIYNTLPGTTTAAVAKAGFLKEVILGETEVLEISQSFAFELLFHMFSRPVVKPMVSGGGVG